MNCPRCQTECAPDARFCMHCGAALSQRCASCQTILPAGARYCPHCGQPVQASASSETAPTSASPTDPGRSLTPLTGERRVVTVLFVDVVGSTFLAEQVDVETWTAVMNQAFDRITPAIQRYGGTISQWLGDAVVALFGVPVAHEDDPVRAVRAALDLLDLTREYAGQVRRDHGLEFAIRACLNTGAMVVRRGDSPQYDYTAMGGVVNHAALLKFVGPPMTVLISGNTHHLVAPFFDCTDLGTVKNRSEPLRVYQVQGPRATLEPARGTAGLKSPMLGRDAELAALLQLDEAVRAGLGRTALIVGGPGLGKTRLIAEWQAAATRHPSTRWVTGRCVSYGQDLAYHLLLDLLRSLVGVSPAADEAGTHDALLALTQDLFGDDAADVHPYLGHLLSLELDPMALAPIRSLSPQALQARTQAALRRLLQALVARQPLVLILENLQWADPASVELLVDLLPLASANPVLFCLAARPDHDTSGWRLVAAAREVMGQRLTELTLRPLSEADSRQLIANLLGHETLPDPVQALILKKAEGNPFFVEEVIRMLIDRGAIVRSGTRWVAEAAIRDVTIPDHLQGLLLARIDRLPDDVKHVLRVAAVIGRQFSAQVLQQVLGMEDQGGEANGVINALGTLESAGLIRMTQVSPELAYAFQYALVHEAVYGSLLRDDRQQLHRAVGETLERLYPERLASRDLAPRLGQHFDAAGDEQRALAYYALAGDAALASYANREAECRYRRALDLAPSDAERANLLSGLGQALFWQSRFAEAIPVWRQAIDLYLALGPEGLDGVAWAYARLARATWHVGDTPETLRLCQEGLAAAEGAPASPGEALLLHEAARAYLFNGLSDPVRSLCQQALEMAERLGVVEVQVETLATMGLLADQSPAQAQDALTRAVDLAESAGLLGQAARAHVNLAALLSTGGADFQAAHDHYRRAAELNRSQGNTASELLAQAGAANVSLSLGDLEEVASALPALRQLLSRVTDPGPAVFHVRNIEALLLRYQGELSMATRLMRALQTEERQRGNLQNLIDVDGQLAEILLEPHVLPESVEVGERSPLARGQQGEDATLVEAEAALAEAIEIGDSWLTDRVRPRCLLSVVRTCQRRFEDANHLLAEAQEVAGSPLAALDEAYLTLGQARLAAAQERWPDALAAFEIAAGVYARLGWRWWRARLLQEWAEAHFSRRELTDLERARVLLREALTTFEGVGASHYAALAAGRLSTLRDATYARALAHQKAAQDLAVARKVQESFLPTEPPRLPGWQLTAALEPAREASGDFYDFIPLPEERLGIVIADVADKGAGAALYMALSRTLIRTYAAEHDARPELVLGAVNRRILEDTQSDLFVTVFYGVLDPTSGRLTYANAGHNPPIVCPRDGAATPALHQTGVPLGLFGEQVWEQRAIQIAPGDALVLYTDGVTDAENEEVMFFGLERLLASVQASRGQPTDAARMQAALLAAIRGFVGDAPQFDDLTLMVVARSAPSS